MYSDSTKYPAEQDFNYLSVTVIVCARVSAPRVAAHSTVLIACTHKPHSRGVVTSRIVCVA